MADGDRVPRAVRLGGLAPHFGRVVTPVTMEVWRIRWWRGGIKCTMVVNYVS